MEKHKIELSKCPYCQGDNYERNTDDYQEDYVIMACYCNECEKSFTEYFSLDEVKFDDPNNEEDDVFYTNNLSEQDKKTVIKAINLLIAKENDVNDYSRIINVMNGGCNKE